MSLKKAIPWDGANFLSLLQTVAVPKLPLVERNFYSRGVTSTGKGLTMWNPNNVNLSMIDDNLRNTVNNKAIDKVSEKLIVIDNLFEAIYERNEAFEMLKTAGGEVFKFLKNWKNPSYYKTLAKNVSPADLPSAWLMWNFGVQPLVGTIDTAFKLLGKPFPVTMVRGMSKKNISYYHDVKFGNYQRQTGQVTGYYANEKRVYVTPKMNPNAAMANVMGLTTPYSTAFSVLPWGWAADYFLNCSQLLNNFENRFPGVDVSGVFESYSIKLNAETMTRTTVSSPPVNEFRVSSAHYCGRNASSLIYRPAWSFPSIGDKTTANLFSAIALSMKGK